MLVNCVAYKNGKKLADIDPSEIGAHVHSPDHFVWVALLDPTEAELEQMGEQFDLHPLAVEDAQHGHQRPKIEEYGDSLFAVAHLVERERSRLRVGELDIFVGKNYALTCRRGAETGFGDVRNRCERDANLLQIGAGFVLYALLDAIVDRYFPVLDALRTEFEAIEERIFAEQRHPRVIIASLYELSRKLTLLKRAVEPLLDAMAKLFGGRVPKLCVGMDDYYRDVADHLARLVQSIDSTSQAVTNAMSVNIAINTIQENEIIKRLGSYAALVAAPTLVAGVYGMNFDALPGLRWEYGYVFAIVLMILIDAILYVRFKRAGWL